MSRPVSAPRIPPLAPDDQDDRQRELLAGVAMGGPASNIFATLVRHPGLFRHWLPFGGSEDAQRQDPAADSIRSPGLHG